MKYIRYEYNEGTLAVQETLNEDQISKSKITFDFKRIDGSLVEKQTYYNSKKRIREIIVKEYIQVDKAGVKGNRQSAFV